MKVKNFGVCTIPSHEIRSILTKENLLEIMRGLPRHRPFSYINFGSIPEDYFKRAEKTLPDGYIYLAVTRSKSASGEVIGLFTNKRYNHVSLSFDRELGTAVSYNGGGESSRPGLNAESAAQLTKRKGASVILYRLPAAYRATAFTFLIK